MKAITFHGIRDVRHDDARDPRIEDAGDAVIAVERAAVCGSDLHIYHGREVGIDVGTVLGHECVGRVLDLGAAVRDLRVGDRVASAFSTSCGACYFCARGLTARCVSGRLFGWVERGVGLQGAQAERLRVPFADSTLYRIPDDLDADRALLICDVLPTGLYCARRAEISAGDTVVVLGCGPVGLMAVAAAHALGAGTVLAVDTVPERLALAERFGASAVDARTASAHDVARAATDGRGADAVLEAIGSEESTALAFRLVRAGGTISAVGVHHESRFAFSPAQAYDHNLTYRIGRCPARVLMDDAFALLRARPELAEIVTHRMRLAEGREAYARFDARRDGCIKITLTP